MRKVFNMSESRDKWQAGIYKRAAMSVVAGSVPITRTGKILK
jgi:hypothetical protein